MKRTLFLVTFLCLALSFVATAQDVTAVTAQTGLTDEQLVKQAVNTYIAKNDAEAVKRVLSPEAKIISIDTANKKVTESLISRPYKAKTGETVSPGAQKITAVDITDGGALVKVETTLSAPGVTPQPHTQYISLLKVGQEWKIVSILMPPLRFDNK